MMTKDDLDKEITKIADGVRHRPTFMAYIPMPPAFRRRFDDLLNQCVDMQKELLGVGDDMNNLLELQKRFFSLEADYQRLRTSLVLMPSVVFLYLGCTLVFIIIKWIDFPKFITETLGVEAPEKLITLGIAGAFLYLATSLLAKTESVGGPDHSVAAVANFTIRLSLAIVVPIVLVVLFFTKEGKVAEAKVSPEILSFACGYSAKLVMDLFNKIVEKGSKIIQAL